MHKSVRRDRTKSKSRALTFYKIKKFLICSTVCDLLRLCCGKRFAKNAICTAVKEAENDPFHG